MMTDHKNLIIYSRLLVLVGLAGWLSACDVFDVDPSDRIPADEAITDERGLNAALTGAFDALQNGSISQDYTTFGDLAADNLIPVGSRLEYYEVADHAIQTNNFMVEGIWNGLYDGINRVNNVLAAIPGVEGMSEEAKQPYYGRLRFLRALQYGYLVNMFGGVPLRTEPVSGISQEALNEPRASVGETYVFIIDELEQAVAELDGTGAANDLFADQGAAMALLARAYLYAGRYQEAYDQATDVILSGYELTPGSSYGLLYDENAAPGEIIFRIDYARDLETIGIADWMLPDGRFEVAATEAIGTAYTVDDLREEASIGDDGSGTYWSAKYQDLETNSDNIIVLRLAEMYLIRAEAALRGELSVPVISVQGDINTIRNRAGLPDVSDTDPEDLLDIVMEERRLEFAFEGHRWFDLKRSGRAVQQLGLTSANQLLFPIPQSELDTNQDPDMTQNPGY